MTVAHLPPGGAEDAADGSKARGPAGGIVAPSPSRRSAQQQHGVVSAMDASMDSFDVESVSRSNQHMSQQLPSQQQPGYRFTF